MEGSKPTKTINAARTTFQVLDALRALNGAGVTEVAEYVGVSKGTAYNHLHTLEREHFVVKDDANVYDVSLKFLTLAHYAKNQYPILDLVAREVDSLAAQTGEMALFTVEEHGQGVCLHVAYGENAVRTPLYVGHRSDLHNTAVGKAILAYKPREVVERIVAERGLAAETKHTITDPERLFDDLEAVRERDGIAFNREETISGLAGVGAPLRRYDGTVVGALSVIGPASRMTGDRLERELPELIERSVNIVEVNSTAL